MGRLLTEATAALARLDTDALGELERRALNLQALLADGGQVLALPELQSRYRVFAAVMAATGENLKILERAGSGGAYGTAGGGTQWAL